jgi:hypothetical protein
MLRITLALSVCVLSLYQSAEQTSLDLDKTLAEGNVQE